MQATDELRVLDVLLVDDNPDDRAQAIRELSRVLPDRQYHQVTDLKQFTRALERGSWDLVVTDYRLRWSDGFTILMPSKPAGQTVQSSFSPLQATKRSRCGR